MTQIHNKMSQSVRDSLKYQEVCNERRLSFLILRLYIQLSLLSNFISVYTLYCANDQVPSCMEGLAENLGIIFGTRLVSGIAV